MYFQGYFLFLSHYSIQRFMSYRFFLRLLYVAVLYCGIISCSSEVDVHQGSSADSINVYDIKYPLPSLMVSGHRGIKNHSELPENCLESFIELRKKGNLIIECDVHRSKDSTLLLMHDNTLDRTTTGSGRVVDFNWADLENLKLKIGDNITPYRVPSFEDILDWAVESETILSVDIKRSVPEELIIEKIRSKGAEDYCMLISYTLKQAQKVYKLAPELMQSVSIRNLEEYYRWKKSGIPANRTIAFTGTRRSPVELYDQLHLDKIACIFGTLGNVDAQAERQGPDVYLELVETGVDIFATDRPLVVIDFLANLKDK